MSAKKVKEKKSTHRPYIQFYVADFMASPEVLDMTTLQVGALILLLFRMAQSKEPYLPNDDKVLAKICRMTSIRFKKNSQILKQYFTLKDGKLYSAEIEKAIAAYDRSVENSRKGGIASGVSRSTKNRSTVEPRLNQPEPEPKPFIKKENTIKENDGFKDKGLGKDKVAEHKPAALSLKRIEDIQAEEAKIRANLLSLGMLDALHEVEELPLRIMYETDCTEEQAKQLITLFVNQQKQNNKQYTHFDPVINHCVNWSKKRAPYLLKSTQ